MSNKDNPECQYCIFSSNDGRSNKVTCRYHPINERQKWPVVGADEFCGKWRGVNKEYTDLFPKEREN